MRTLGDQLLIDLNCDPESLCGPVDVRVVRLALAANGEESVRFAEFTVPVAPDFDAFLALLRAGRSKASCA